MTQTSFNFNPLFNPPQEAPHYHSKKWPETEPFCLSILSHGHEFATSCGDLASFLLPLEIYVLGHLGPVEAPKPLPEAGYSGPRIPTHIRKHVGGPANYGPSAFRAEGLRPWCRSPDYSYMLRVVSHLREDFLALVRDNAQVGCIRPGHDQGGPNEYGYFIWKALFRPFRCAVLRRRSTYAGWWEMGFS